MSWESEVGLVADSSNLMIFLTEDDVLFKNFIFRELFDERVATNIGAYKIKILNRSTILPLFQNDCSITKIIKYFIFKIGLELLNNDFSKKCEEKIHFIIYFFPKNFERFFLTVKNSTYCNYFTKPKKLVQCNRGYNMIC